MRAQEFDTPVFYHGSEFKFDQFKSTSGTYWFTDDLRSARSLGPHVISARLTLKNPYHWQEGDPEPDLPNFRNYLISKGHDGVIAPSNISLGNDYIVFDPKQIKIIGSRTFSRDEEQLDELTL